MSGNPDEPVTHGQLDTALERLEDRWALALERLHTSLRWEMVLQTFAIVGLILLVWYGTLQSNQQAGGLGISASQIADEAADRAIDRNNEAILEELRRQSDERAKQD
jgi:hypothetical protein